MGRDRIQDVRRHLAAQSNSSYKKKSNLTGDVSSDRAPAKSNVDTRQASRVPSQSRPRGKPFIVVGYDGTAGALPALHWALAEAKQSGKDLRVVRAWQSDDELAESGQAVTHQQLVDLARNTLPIDVQQTAAASVIVDPQSACKALLDAAEGSSMIVVGRRHLGPLTRVGHGSVSRDLIHHARCPVVVVPGSTCSSPNATSSRIVVGFDGSQPGWEALRWAAREASSRQSALEAVMVYDISSPALSFGLAAVASPNSDRLIAERASQAVIDAVDRVRERDLDMHALASPGRPGPVLVSLAHDADLLVLGSAGHGHLTEMILGSTVSWCLRHAPCPIVTIPHVAVADRKSSGLEMPQVR